MEDLSTKFKKHGYVKVNDCLPAKMCQEITNHLFQLEKNNKTKNDIQCPISSSIYGDYEYCEKLLFEFKPKIEKIVEKKIVPTYSYARIYKNGETLERHLDREACEVSVSLTVGYDAEKIWEIYFGNGEYDAVEIEVGSMVIYKGSDLFHWRNEFKGKWQTQVFLHYVEMGGPNMCYALDNKLKRKLFMDKYYDIECGVCWGWLPTRS